MHTSLFTVSSEQTVPGKMLSAHLIQQLLGESPTLLPVFRWTLEVIDEQTLIYMLEMTHKMHISGTDLKNDGSDEPRMLGGSFLKRLKKTEHADYIVKH